MQRFVFALLTAVLFIAAPAVVFAEGEVGIDLATTNTNQCPCTPIIEDMGYNDFNSDGDYDPPGETLAESWPSFLLREDCTLCSRPWRLYDVELAGARDGVFNSGSDTGKSYFAPAALGKYYICGQRPTVLTEPKPVQKTSRSTTTGGSSAIVKVVENPDPDNVYAEYTTLCYEVVIRHLCNNVKVRFGINNTDLW